MNIQILALSAALGVGLLAAGGYVVKSQINARVEAEVIATAQKTRADLAEQSLTRIQENLQEEIARQTQLMTELQGARDQQANRTRILEDRDRITQLTQAKPGLMEARARKRTVEIWKDLEELSRE